MQYVYVYVPIDMYACTLFPYLLVLSLPFETGNVYETF